MKNLTKFTFIFTLLFISTESFAQIGINATGAAPDAKAMLDISSTSKGFLWPRMTLAQRNAISAAPGITPDGLTIFDTDTKNLWIYKNSAWKPYLPSPWDVNGNNIFNTNTESVLIGTGAPIPGLPNKLLVVATSTDAIRAFSETGCTVCATNSIGSAVAGNAISTGYGGYFTSTSGYALITGTGNVGIGTFGPTQKLDIDGQIRIRGGSPGSGKVLTSTADGTGTWESLAGSHDHFGESWYGPGDYGLTIINANKVAFSGYGNTASRSKGIFGSSISSTGTGVYGVNLFGEGAALYGAKDNSGVSGVSKYGVGVYGAGDNGRGLWGLSNISEGVYGNSVSGISILGQKQFESTTGSAGVFEVLNAANTSSALVARSIGNTALEIDNGYIKVSGTTKTAFVITAGSGGTTIVGNRVRFSYPGMSSTDILIVNHQFVSTYIGAVGNWYETSILAPVNQWTIFREDNLAMPAGEKFTVLVIKQ